MAVEPLAWRRESHPIWLFRLVQITLSPVVRFLFQVARQNVEKLPKTGPVIVVSNHPSVVDPILVLAAVARPIFHVGKHTLFKHPLARFFLERLGGQILVDRETGGNNLAIEAGVLVLERGLALGIYPEGTRSRDGGFGRAQTGVALFAFLTGAPVYPVALQGVYEVWPRHRKFPRLFRRTRVMVGDPIRVARDPEAANDPRRCRKLTDDIMTTLARMLGQEYQRSRMEG